MHPSRLSDPFPTQDMRFRHILDQKLAKKISMYNVLIPIRLILLVILWTTFVPDITLGSSVGSSQVKVMATQTPYPTNPLSSNNQADRAGLVIKATVRQYDYDHYNRVVASKTVFLPDDHDAVLELNGATWRLMLNERPVAQQVPGQVSASDLDLSAVLIKGSSKQTNITLEVIDGTWSADNYVLMPGAAYNGNRFNWRRIAYSPKLLDPKDIGPEKPAIISDVPRLDIGNGPSRLHDRSGSMSVPVIGVHSPGRSQNYWLMTYQGNHLGDYGMEVEESRDRKQGLLGISSPVVRELYKYRITDSRFPSDDQGHDFIQGDTVHIRARLVVAAAQSLNTLFDNYWSVRKALYPAQVQPTVLPMSAAFTVQERKYNSLNWVPQFGYYAIGKRESFLMDWQIGWTGGMILTLPLLYAGADSSVQRVIQNLDWLFPNGISPSGYFYDSGEKGNIWHGGDVRKPTSKNWHLVRKGGDGLYFVLRHLQVMQDRNKPLKPSWVAGTRGVADAFVKTWRKNGQWGQFVDSNTGEVTVGGSTSAAIVPAALALASVFYKDTTYLSVAEAGAALLYRTSTKTGLTTGGPGDALQNPDSESAYALIESYITLYELTGKTQYLDWAKEAAAQFATWVCSYNYSFPPKSLFGRTGIKSVGAVLANTQNKHGAPGICTFSGQALLKLTLATGDPRYADLLQDIAHGMPQYLGHPDKPIEKVQDGFMCERVSMTDWLEGIGEITYQTTWAEASLALSYTELPGLLIDPAKRQLWAFDNTLTTTATKGKKWQVTVRNPTRSKMKLRLLTKLPQLQTGKVSTYYNAPYQILELGPGQQKVLTF